MSATRESLADLDAIRPLPIRIKQVHNESMDSYIRRLATANATSATTIGVWLQETGILSPIVTKATWHAAWRRLAGQSTTRHSHADQPPALDRRLCPRCSRGQSASGQIPGWGLICLRHSSWIDPRDGAHSNQSETQAERAFRRAMVPRGLRIESPQMEFALHLVALAVTPSWIAAQAQRHGHRTLRAQLFVPQVRIAIDLFDHDQLRALTLTKPGQRLMLCEEWLQQRINGLGITDEPWRGAGLLSTCVQQLAEAGTSVDIDQVLHRLSR